MLLVLTGATSARAGTDELCAEQAYGVPGPQPKYPEWWDPSLTAQQRETRWTGSTSIYDVGSAAPPLGSGRVIWDKPSQRLFFEYDINGDPSLDVNEDIVMLAVSDPTGTDPDLYIQFQPLGNCSPLSNCTGLGSAVPSTWVKYSEATVGTSVTWSTLSTTNPSTSWTVQNPWVEVSRNTTGGVTTYNWKLKFALEIPVDAGTGEAWPDLHIYGNAVMYMPGTTSGTAVEYPLLCDPPSATSNDCLVFSTGMPSLPQGLPVANLSNLWSHVSTGNVTQCDGVEIQRRLVGSDYNTYMGTLPGTTTSYEYPGYKIPKFSGARLRAGFINDTTNALLTGEIDAAFSIANWGLQYSTWGSASWTQIATASLFGTVSAGAYAGANGQGMVETSSPWVPSTSGLPLTNDHQCMHVHLTANGAGINFKRDSVYRNMDLVNASVFRRPLDLDMTGRELPEGQETNDVFLLVRTENMPSVEQCIESGNTLRGCFDGGPLVLDPGDGIQEEEEPEPWELEEQGVQELPADGAEPGVGNVPALPEPMEPFQADDDKDGTEYAKLEELPKYMVHAFVDTGGFINLPGAPQTRVLKEFSQFGYYVQHEGEPAQGWEQYMTAPGAEPVPQTPGLYEIHVPPDQVLALVNTVRVVDGVQDACGVLPDTNGVMTLEEEFVKTEELRIKGLDGQLKEEKVLEPDFGCAPPPLREPCALDSCTPHNPISYVDGSRYVGEWTEEALAAIYARQNPDGLTAPGSSSAAEAEEDELEDELGDLSEVQDGCCAQASVDPQAGRRGAARLSAMAMLLLLLRRGRRRRRRQ